MCQPRTMLLGMCRQYYTPKDKLLIPRGEIAPVVGTSFDFMQPRLIGSRVAQVPGGYGESLVLTACMTHLELSDDCRLSVHPACCILGH